MTYKLNIHIIFDLFINKFRIIWHYNSMKKSEKIILGIIFRITKDIFKSIKFKIKLSFYCYLS